MGRRIGGAGGGSDPAGKSGAVVAAGVLAVSLAAGGGMFVSGGAATDPAGVNLNKARYEGRKSARKGDADGAWRQLNMRTLKHTARQAAECITHSFGQVQVHFTRNPCTSLDRSLFVIGDDNGAVAVVSVVWVGFRTRRDAREFKELIDVHGTGDVRPLATPLLDLADIRFTGLHYQSRPDGNTVVIAETEPTSGRASGEMLDVMADVASWLPR